MVEDSLSWWELSFTLNGVAEDAGVTWPTAKKAFDRSVEAGWLVEGTHFLVNPLGRTKFSSSGRAELLEILRSGRYKLKQTFVMGGV